MKSNDGIQIRDALERDIEAMQDVTLSAYKEYGEIMPAWAWEDYRDSIVSTIAGEGSAMERIIAEQGGAIVGSVVLLPAGITFSGPTGVEWTTQWPEIRLLAVPPEGRGKGVGSALIEECIERARRVGSQAITLHTTDMMQIAMQMYERRGFVRMPELDFYPVPEVVIKGYRFDIVDS